MQEPSPTQIPNWLSWAITGTHKSQPTFLGHAVLVVLFLSVVSSAYYVLLFVSSQWEQKWITPSRRLNAEQVTLQTAWLKSKPAVKDRLIFQLQEIEALIDRNASIMGFFISNIIFHWR